MDRPSTEQAEEIRKAVKSKYQEVAVSPEGLFAYPVGTEGASTLGYAQPWLDLVPAEVVRRFVGVGNPFSIRKPRPGAESWMQDAVADSTPSLPPPWLEFRARRWESTSQPRCSKWLNRHRSHSRTAT